MIEKTISINRGKCDLPQVLPVREQSNLITQLVMNRLDTVLPLAMKEAGLDMWIILCQEDDLDPIYKTMIPMDCWSPILQMLIFIDEGDDLEAAIGAGIIGMSVIFAMAWFYHRKKGLKE